MKITDTTEGISPCAPEPEELSEESVIHWFPELGMGPMPCCNVHPLHAPLKDRMTINLSLRTCPNPIGPEVEEEQPEMTEEIRKILGDDADN